MDYRDYLMSRCKVKRNYTRLMDDLLSYPFFWLIKFDENRAKDGASVRYDFLKFNNISVDFIPIDQISVLEVLVAFSERIVREYIGDPADPHPEIMFWEMICNLKLNLFDNKNYNKIQVQNIINRFLNRKYSSKGIGNIFPLPNTNSDQRMLELWSQMNEYLKERGY